MAKLANYIMLLSGISLLFYFTGLLNDTLSSALLSLILNPENIKGTPWWEIVFSPGGIITLAAGAVVMVGWIATKSDLWLNSLFIPVFLSYGWDFLAIYGVLTEVNPILSVLFIGPVLLTYTLMVIEWWRGLS